MNSISVSIHEVLGSRLSGRLAGQRDFARICEALAGTLAGSVVLLDFQGIPLVSGSWANAALVPLIKWATDSQIDLYPVLLNASAESLEDMRLVAQWNHQTYLHATGRKGIPSKATLVGSLDLGQTKTLQHVLAFGEVTGAELERRVNEPVNAWQSPHLHACAISGAVKDAGEDLRPILENKNADHKRPQAVAIVNARDVDGPEDLSRNEFSCYITMSEVSIEGLRQAFLDPESRLRLSGDPKPDAHTELLAISWQGGFLDGAGVHFSENLNVLVGGRGTGKSTVVESLRYVLGLEPLGDEATKAHEGIVRRVLGSGTKISLLVRSHRPSNRAYLIERTVPSPPIVRDEEGGVLTLSPTDVVPQVEVYGQHEISEFAKSPEKRTRLLDRFVDEDPDLVGRKRDVRRELERSRSRILDVLQELNQIEDRLASLPAIEEKLKRFTEAGLEERLKERSLIVREEQGFRTASERITPFRDIVGEIRRELPIDCAFLSDKALEDLPGREILSEARVVLEKLNQDLEAAVAQMGTVLEKAGADLAAVRAKWETHKKTADDAYEKILRELQKSRIDGAEFIRVREQIEALRPLRERLSALKRDEKEHENQRRNLLAEWEGIKSEEFRQLAKAAKKVSKQLEERVRVSLSINPRMIWTTGLSRMAWFRKCARRSDFGSSLCRSQTLTRRCSAKLTHYLKRRNASSFQVVLCRLIAWAWGTGVSWQGRALERVMQCESVVLGTTRSFPSSA